MEEVVVRFIVATDIDLSSIESYYEKIQIPEMESGTFLMVCERMVGAEILTFLENSGEDYEVLGIWGRGGELYSEISEVEAYSNKPEKYKYKKPKYKNRLLQSSTASDEDVPVMNIFGWDRIDISEDET